MTSWRSTPLPKDWKRRREKALRRDGYVCQLRYAGCVVTATDVDHIVPPNRWPQGKPGVDDLDNLQAACGPCHDTKTIVERRPPRARPAERHPGEL